jgi:malate dehydrogenase (oxaloacetate-decarboxylating)
MDYNLLFHSLLNKGTAFTNAERTEFGLHGLLPVVVTNLEEQEERAYESFKNQKTSLEQYINLRSLQDSNETLFYKLVMNHIEEIMPIIYTPEVGEGCINFSHLYRRSRGVFISYPNAHRIEQILANPRFQNTAVIVVSDGERILGLGDQGAGGIGIPIGKLSLYTACAGIHPMKTLPILLDTGTDNSERLADPLYVGWNHRRIRGEEYDDFIDQFVQAVKKQFPHVLLQWEDFAQQNASPILERYKNELCTFNDDIQGTAAVATGTLLAAIQVAGGNLKDQRIVIVGAGSAGCGIAHLMKQAMVDEGLSEMEACKHFYLIDREGLLLEEGSHLPLQKAFVHLRKEVASWQQEGKKGISLEDVIRNVDPTVLIGVSGQGGIFTEAIVKEMARRTKRPIIFPLSNPTNRSEANPADLIKWTEGRVIIGTGSPFDAVTKAGRPFRVDQTNNAYIFPGIGLGLIAVQAKRATDSMFMLAAKALANCSPAKNNPEANLLPPLTQIRDVSFQIALVVAKEAIHLGLADQMTSQELEMRIHNSMWTPAYLPFHKMTG